MLTYAVLTLLCMCAGELTNLTVLRLAYNDLETASMTIDGLLNLEELVLTSNRLSGIPHSFANLRKLSTLQVCVCVCVCVYADRRQYVERSATASVVC